MHGLRIRLAGEGAPAAGHELAWRVSRVPGLAPDGIGAEPREVVRDGRRWAQVGIVDQRTGDLACRWYIAEDGSAVDCESAAWMCAGDLQALLHEPIMRHVLPRRGLASLHAAALVSDGRAILVMGDSGAGKSSLAGALAARGWRPLADDLVRVDEVGGRWRAHRGVARVSVNGDTAAALGLAPADLATRWSLPIEVTGDKYVLPFEAVALETAPVAALLFVAPRTRGATALEARSMPAGEQVARMVASLSPGPTPGPTPAGWVAVQGLLRQCEAIRLSLPDSLERLQDAAAALDRRLGRAFERDDADHG